MQSEQFLRDVLATGDRTPVVARCDVHSSGRIKLVKQGVRLTSAMYDRLVNHKLLEPLEQCLEVEDGVRRDSLAERARGLMVPGGHFALLTQQVTRGKLSAAFSNVALPAPIAFKLTVAREQRPRLFEHSIEVALLAAYLASRSGWDVMGLANAAAAGLLHDLGELHLDPILFDRARPLRADEYEFIYSHPVSGYLIVQAQLEYPALVREAVLEHHERLDGSGYPRGLRDGAISELGQILAAAEVGAVLLRRATQTGVSAELDVPVRMMWHKFDPRLIGFLADLLAIEPPGGDSPALGNLEGYRQQLQAIADVLIDWSRTKADIEGAGDEDSRDDLLNFVTARVDRLNRVLLATGFDPRAVDGFVGMLADDGTLRGELSAIAHEATWAFSEVQHELQRRWGEFAAVPQTGGAAIAAWLARADARVASVAPA